jgi:DNA-binding winged helix-turn-helix (wHTH) protein
VKSARYLHFSAFCLDRIEEQLWQGREILPLRRKPFAVLRYLMEHAGELVTREALLDALWPHVHGKRRGVDGAYAGGPQGAGR